MWIVSPGTMWAVALTIEVLGIDNVNPGYWPGPFYLIDVSESDAKALLSLLNEQVPGHTLTHY